MKIYEYMAAGKAIIASRAGQISEVIQHGENGYLVDPGDIHQLASAMNELSNDQENRHRLGAKARDDAVKYYSWESYAENLGKIFQRVLAGMGDG